MLLIIDDDAQTRDLMKMMFEQDFTVICASGGQTGLQLIERNPVDVVLLDLMMPEMDGFEVLQQIRSNPQTQDLPVIIASALNENEHVVKGLKCGANDYLTKPINLHVAHARLTTQVKVKRLLDERKQAVEKLKRASEMREQFFRIASHDLKNPLTNLRLALHELSYFVPETDPEAMALQTTIDETLSSMQELIEEFLDVTAIRSGKIDMSPGLIEIKTCVKQVAAQYAQMASKKQICLQVGESSGVVMADRQRLMQVIGNLVSNAIKFSPRGANVTLWAQPCGGGSVRVYVGDEGPGISDQQKEMLFTEFGRVGSRATGGESSTGLGLWIVKHLTQYMGGTVGVESMLGVGSVFWIELPAVELEQLTMPAAAQSA